MRRFRETEVNMPSGNVDKPLIEDNRDGTVSVKYEPKEEGLHELVVKYNGENVQETSKPTEPLLAIPIVDISCDQSASSQASAGFVPMVRPPEGWLQTSGHGRWRQQHDDPYQGAQCPLQRVLATDAEGDGPNSSSRPAIDRQLYAHVDKLKKSAMAADFRPREDVKKPEWVKVAKEGLRVREIASKVRSLPGTRHGRTEEVPPKAVECYHNFHGVVKPKFVVPEKDAVDQETAGVSEKRCNNGISGDRPSPGKNENEYSIGHKSEISESPMDQTIVNNSVSFKGLHPNPGPFTFGKRPKAINGISGNGLRPVQKSGVSRRVFIKERLLSSNARGRDSNGLESSDNDYCICKDFVRSEPIHTWSGKGGSSHSISEKVPQKDKTDSKNHAPKRELYLKEISLTTDKSVPKRILQSCKITSKESMKTDDGKNSPKENVDSKTCENDIRSAKTEFSVKFTERLEAASQAAKNGLNPAKGESYVHVLKEEETASQTNTSGVQNSETHSSLKMSPLAKTAKGKEIASQTTTRATKTLETQTSREAEEAAMGTETASQTNVIMSPDFETRADGCQTDTLARPEHRPHSTTLVVPARKSSLRSLTTDGAGGDPCAPCPSTLSGGFVPGCGSRSEVRRLTAAAATRPVSHQSSSSTRRSPPTVCSTMSITPERRRCRIRAKIVDSSDDSFVSAAAALPAGAAPRRLGLDELSLSSRCSTASDSGGFLSASSSCESLRSALAAPEAVFPPPMLMPVLGIPMSGARPAAGETPRRAAERQKRRCSRTLEQLGMTPRLRGSNTKDADAGAVSVSGNDATGSSGSGSGRPGPDGGVFRSATSVSEVAPCSGGDATLAGEEAGTAWGRWRRAARNEKQRLSVDGVSELYGDRAATSRSKHAFQVRFATGSPFKFHVDSISSGYVTAHGPGLVHGITGEPANFTISTKDAGAGGLSLAVEGPSKAEISCHDNKDGTVSVSYLPTSPGEYKVAVKFADKHIKGSPYSVKVTGEGRKRNQVSLGSQSEVTLPGKVTEKDIKALNASITAPSGLEEPCFLKQLANDHLGISFTPREIGQHLVMVKKKGVEISGSPFKIMVSPKEVGDASKVKVSGAALKEGKTHQDNKVLIDTKEAGYGGLSMSIEGPSKAEIKCDDKDDGKLEVSYNPKEPGFYIINLKFADHHVHGSPFTAKVTGEGSNTQTERIKRDRDAAPITTVGSSCALTFKMPGVSALDLSATVASPGGVVEDANITELEDNLHAVNFVPKELGVHTVSVRYRDVHIPGSPFQFTVGPLKDGGAHRVHAGGPGLERGEQNMPNEFNVWTREAGAGSLAISVEGPSKAEIDFKDRKDGSCYVSYVVSEPGEYRVGVKFNDSHIPDSPYKVYVTPANKDAHRVTVNQLPDAGVQVDKPIVFSVDRSGCKGQLDCKVVSPSGHEDDCFAQYLDEDTYSVRFLPKENGIHQLHVKWNNVHVPGSPFRLKIGKQDADPAAVHAHGKGLEKGHTGHKSDFIVDTCNAGAGTLAVTIDGPSKVAMDCTEVDEGYKVRYTPLSPGHYFVGVKYDGYHIAGSPFKVDVDGDELAERGPKEQSAVVVETIEKVSVIKQESKGPSMPKFDSDPTKVTSKGMGLKKAFVGRQNQFTVDAGCAGQDMLWVGCYGPKNPCEEVHIKHTGRNQYQVFYTVKERGKYILVVRWGEKDIPGSPFEVEV